MGDTTASLMVDLTSLIEQLPGHVYWKDLQGRVLGCNQLQAELLGFKSPKDIVGKTMLDLFSAEDAAKIMAVDQAVINNKQAIQCYESPVIKNKQKYFISHKVPFKDPLGEVCGVLGISFEITEQYEAQITQLQVLKNIIALMPGHVYWKDAEGKMQGCNLAQAKFCGVDSPDQLIGKTMFDLLPKADAEKVVAVDQEVMKGDHLVSRYESAIINNEPRHFISKKVSLKNKQGDSIGILGVSFDMTAEYQAQLRKFQTYEHIISLVPAHVYWKDLDGRYLGCNQQQAQSIGLKNRDDIIGKTDFDMPWREVAEAVRAFDQKVIATNREWVQEESGKMKDGVVHVYLSHKSPLLDDQGKTMGIVGVSIDISQQKQMEQLKAERAQISKLIAASIAHELRTPMASVNLIATTLRQLLPELLHHSGAEESIPRPVAPEQWKLLKDLPSRLEAITKSANTFIDMMLMKVDTEKVKVGKLVPLSMQKCIAESLELYPLTENERRLIEVNPHNNFEFMGDPLLIRHVLFNLLKNALYYVKAANKGKISIWLEPGEPYSLLHFKDTGTGIAPEILPHLFMQFLSKTRHGSGVGLSLCKMIMQEFNGDITCDTVFKEYSHFILSFPNTRYHGKMNGEGYVPAVSKLI